MKKFLFLFLFLLIPLVSATWPADYANTWTTVGIADSISLDENCMHSFDGFDFCWKSDGTISILRDGIWQASSEFGMSGVSKKAIYALSSDYVWDWNVIESSPERIEVEGKQVDYGNKDFKWKITLIVGRNSSLKIKNYVENTTKYDVTDLNFFYLFNVNTEVNPAVEYVGKDDNVNQFSLKTEEDEKEEKGEKKEKFKGNHLRTDKKELKEIVNNISAPLFNFQFQDMIDSNYFLTYLYFGNLHGKKTKAPDANGFIVGFSLTGGALAVGQSYEIDPGIWLSLGDIGEGILALAILDGNLFTGHYKGVLGTYNSTSNVWTSLPKKSGTGSDTIYEFAVYDGNLFTGTNDGNLGTYNSTSGVWSSLGDKGNSIIGLAVYDGNLFTGDQSGILGTYNSTSNVWTSLGDKGSTIGPFVVYDGNLFAGSLFGILGTYNSTSNIWTSLMDIGGTTQSFAVYDGNLFAGDSSGNLGTYNSTSNVWTSLCGSIPCPFTVGELEEPLEVSALAVYDGNLFIGGLSIFGTYNSTSNVWTSLGDKGSLESLAVYDRKLFTGNWGGILGYFTTNLPSSFNILGDFNTFGYIKGGTDHNVRFSVSDVNGSTSDFLVDFNFSLTPTVGQGTVVVFKDLNLATAFVHDTNNLNLGFDVNFYYLYSVGLLDANYFACINLKNKAVDLNYGKCSTLSFMVDSTKPSTSWNKDTNYWYTTNQTVSLTCSDNNAGCQSTKYRYATLPGVIGSWTAYTTGVVFSDGKFHIDFNSTDRAVNIGDMNTKFLFVDTAKPVISSDVNNNSWNLLGDANLQMTAYDLTSGIDANWFRIDDNNSSARNWGSWQNFDRNILVDWARFGDGNFGVQYFSRDVARWDSNSDINSTTVYVLLDVNGPEWPTDITPKSGNYVVSVSVTCTAPGWIRDKNYAIDFNTNTSDWNNFYLGPNSTAALDINYFAVGTTKMWFRCKVVDPDKNSGYYTSATPINVNLFTGFDSIGSANPPSGSTVPASSATFSVNAIDADGVAYCRFWIVGTRVGDYNGVGPGGTGSGTWSYTYTTFSSGDTIKADVNCMDKLGSFSSTTPTGFYTYYSPPVPPGGGGGGYPPIPLTVVGPGAPIIRIYPSTKKLELIAGVTKNYSILVESLIDEDLNINIVVPQNLSPFMSLVKKEDILPAKDYVKWEWVVQSPEDLNTSIDGVIEVFANKTPTAVDLQLAQASGLSGLLAVRFFSLGLPTIIAIIFSLILVGTLIRREKK